MRGGDELILRATRVAAGLGLAGVRAVVVTRLYRGDEVSVLVVSDERDPDHEIEIPLPERWPQAYEARYVALAADLIEHRLGEIAAARRPLTRLADRLRHRAAAHPAA